MMLMKFLGKNFDASRSYSGIMLTRIWGFVKDIFRNIFTEIQYN